MGAFSDLPGYAWKCVTTPARVALRPRLFQKPLAVVKRPVRRWPAHAVGAVPRSVSRLANSACRYVPLALSLSALGLSTPEGVPEEPLLAPVEQSAFSSPSQIPGPLSAAALLAPGALISLAGADPFGPPPLLPDVGMSVALLAAPWIAESPQAGGDLPGSTDPASSDPGVQPVAEPSSLVVYAGGLALVLFRRQLCPAGRRANAWRAIREMAGLWPAGRANE